MDFISITLKNWKKFNPRQDVKKPTWFRLDCSLIDDPEFYDFTAEEFKAWIYILSMCCRKNGATIRLFLGHAENSSRISKKSVLSAIKKLETLGIVTVNPNADVTHTYADVTHKPATDGQTDRHDGQDETDRQTNISSEQSRDLLEALPEFSSISELLKLRNVSSKVQASWLNAFPDPQWLIGEIMKAVAWEEANPKRKKRNFGAFLTNWFSRGWDKRRHPTTFNKAQAQSDANVEALKAYARKLGVT